jgi:hypothetical protein
MPTQEISDDEAQGGLFVGDHGSRDLSGDSAELDAEVSGWLIFR